MLLTECLPFFFWLKGDINMPRYVYNGPIMSFNVCIASNWKGETYAPSEAKARNNLAYQFKKQNTRIAGTNISLPGKLLETY